MNLLLNRYLCVTLFLQSNHLEVRRTWHSNLGTILIMEELPVEEEMCDICSDGPRLYKCPRCSIFTCSLTCCKQHKSKVRHFYNTTHQCTVSTKYYDLLLSTQTQCNGIRDRAQFVSSRNFKEGHLKSDYHFLEDVLQTKDRAKRTLAQNCGAPALNFDNYIFLHNRMRCTVGGEKRAHPAKRNKRRANEEVPLILQDTMQRLDSYPKGIKALFNAVCCFEVSKVPPMAFLMLNLYCVR